MNHFVSSRAFPFALVGAIAVGLAGAFACSSSGSSPTTSDAPCTALSQCCLLMTGATSVSCAAIVTSARQANDEAACTSTLLSYTQGGLCSGTPITGVDGGLPCAITNTCPAGPDGGSFHLDTGKPSTDGPASSTCTEIGSCSDGETYQECTAFNGGVCSESFVFSGGSQIACAACGDCTSAQSAAQSFCDTGTKPADAGVDAPACGTAPTLHPEVEAGVYCAFTTTGNIHCASGQQCCETPSTTANGSTCQAEGACPIAGSIAWNCDGPVDCEGSSAGPVCCGVGGTVTLDSTCGFNRGSGFTSTHCATSCVTNEVSICTEATDPCPAGETCTPFKVAGIVLGTCQ